MRHSRNPESGRCAGRGESAARHDPGAQASRPGRQRGVRRRRRWPGPCALEHRRPLLRPPAHEERRRQPVDHLQRGDFQPRRAARDARAQRPRIRHDLGHRGHPAHVRRSRRGLRAALQRPVGVRHLGCAEAEAVPLARPAGNPAVVLRPDGSDLRLRLGNQGAPDASRCRAPARPGRAEPDLHVLVVPAAAQHLSGRAGAAPRTLTDGGTGRHRRAAALADRVRHRAQRSRRRGGVRRTATRPVAGCNPAALARRRSGRRAPERGAGFSGGRGAHQEGQRHAAEDLLDHLRRPGARRERLSERGGQATGNRAPGGPLLDGGHRTGVPRRHLAHRDAHLTNRPRTAVPTVTTRAGARVQGGADR